MSLEVFYSRRALEDLGNLEAWREQYSPKTVKSVLKAVIDTCDLLTAIPEMGALAYRYSAPKGMRCIVVKKKYLVFYTLEPNTVYIVRILDGRQDIERLLGEL